MNDDIVITDSSDAGGDDDKKSIGYDLNEGISMIDTGDAEPSFLDAYEEVEEGEDIDNPRGGKNKGVALGGEEMKSGDDDDVMNEYRKFMDTDGEDPEYYGDK
jgi:hypothetical protein